LRPVEERALPDEEYVYIVSLAYKGEISDKGK
jgi:hypothetical protein